MMQRRGFLGGVLGLGLAALLPMRARGEVYGMIITSDGVLKLEPHTTYENCKFVADSIEAPDGVICRDCDMKLRKNGIRVIGNKIEFHGCYFDFTPGAINCRPFLTDAGVA